MPSPWFRLPQKIAPMAPMAIYEWNSFWFYQKCNPKSSLDCPSELWTCRWGVTQWWSLHGSISVPQLWEGCGLSWEIWLERDVGVFWWKVGVGICGFEGVRVGSGGKWDFVEGELGDGVKVRVSSTWFGFLVGFFMWLEREWKREGVGFYMVMGVWFFYFLFLFFEWVS